MIMLYLILAFYIGFFAILGYQQGERKVSNTGIKSRVFVDGHDMRSRYLRGWKCLALLWFLELVDRARDVYVSTNMEKLARKVRLAMYGKTIKVDMSKGG